MLEFFRAYVSPNSATRAKLSIQLVAQASGGAVAAKTDSAEEKEQTASKAETNGTTKEEDSISAPNTNGTETNGHAHVNGSAEGKKTKKPVLIEDVPAFKASMSLSAIARPVKDISEFEELEPKL